MTVIIRKKIDSQIQTVYSDFEDGKTTSSSLMNLGLAVISCKSNKFIDTIFLYQSRIYGSFEDNGETIVAQKDS